MRTDKEEVDFASYLLKIGEGKEDINEDIGPHSVKIPEDYLVSSIPDMIQKVFPKLESGCENPDTLIGGTIYTPLNKDMATINTLCLEQFPGEAKEYLSADSILEEDHRDSIPIEFLNELKYVKQIVHGDLYENTVE